MKNIKIKIKIHKREIRKPKDVKSEKVVKSEPKYFLLSFAVLWKYFIRKE